MTDSSPSFVGIDVSKHTLDIAIRPSRELWQIPNDEKEFPALAKRLKALAVERVVVEATGGYELLPVTYLAAAGLPVCRVNPRQARFFAQANNQLAKTDSVDAGFWRRWLNNSNSRFVNSQMLNNLSLKLF